MTHYNQKDPYFNPAAENDFYTSYDSLNGASFVGYARTPITSTPSYTANYDSNMVPPMSRAGGFLNTQPPLSAPEFLADGISPVPNNYLANPFANVAVQYGSKLMGTGKEMMDKEINRYIQVPVLKQYFAVDTTYVRNKLRLVFFPFLNKDWSLKYCENMRVGPRNDLNCPDLYLPFMAFLTYVLIAGVLLGINDLFEPEKLGIIASQALAWTIVEVLIQIALIYFFNIQINATTYDIIAYSGYKFIGINMIILSGVSSYNLMYWLGLLYSCLTMGYFTVKTLKWRLMADFGIHQTGVDYRRKQYFLVSLALCHVFQMWWLSSSLLQTLLKN
ncbi:protein YIF1B-B [Halyomorpha halys]|uniref:protein YIF1B-B n=1 Tax=Halyomorpha halys TaxID=286706 RepID=UPI0006D50FA5|nr:protein YIF1B-B [Halyomorpha halys]